MANPQAEDGHTDIANEILEALWKVNLSSYEWRVLLYLLRKTYGWHKKTDEIALSQFSRDIGVDRRHVHRALKMLGSKYIVVAYKGDKGLIKYGFQKNYEKWKLSPIKATVPIQVTKLSPIQAPTKENKKKTTPRPGTPDPEVRLFIDHFCQRYQDKFGHKYPVNGGKMGT